MITDVPGVRAGHWTDEVGRTGVTVVLFPPGTVASGEVRGGAPGTREWALLAPERLVAHLDAVVLAGGSAWGLGACDGVARWCEEQGMGLPTAAGPVPIVVGAVIYDLAVGDPAARPGPEAGREACGRATAGPLATGRVGAGTGATLGSWRGPEGRRPGGVGTATVRVGEVVVSALMVVNAFGDLAPLAAPAPGDDADLGGRAWPAVGPGTASRGLLGAAPTAGGAAGGSSPGEGLAGMGEHTTIGVVATNASLDKLGCLLVAQSAHDGLARALEPAHTLVDGDAVVAAAVGQVTAPLDLVRTMAARAVAAAIRAAPT